MLIKEFRIYQPFENANLKFEMFYCFYRWVNGCGPLSQAFTPEELRKLVRALFQNTDRRAAFLSSIK